jgi:hypothetical protein
MDLMLPPSAAARPLHEAKIEAACRAGMRLPALIGMAIGGSFAVGNPDEFSDLDFKLVSTDSGFAEASSLRDEVVEACGNVIASFPADHLGLDRLLIVLYDDLIHADFDVMPISELATRNEGLPAWVLWEREGELTRELAKPQPERPPFDVEWVERRMWTWLWYSQSKILRGEVYEALAAIQELRSDVLFRLLGLTRGTKVAGSRRIEPLLRELSDSFAATATTADRAALMTALQEVARLYKTLADPLLVDRGIEPAHAARAAVERAMAEALDWNPPG